MKKIAPCVFFALLSFGMMAQMGVNATATPPNAQAMLDVSSPTKGFLPPRMTLANRNAINTVGMQVFCTDCSPVGPYSFNGSRWIPMFITTTSTCPVDMVKTEILTYTTLSTSTTLTVNNLYAYDGTGRVISISTTNSTVVGIGTPTTTSSITTYDYSIAGQVRESVNGVLNKIYILNAAGWATQIQNAIGIALVNITYDAIGYPLTDSSVGTFTYSGANIIDDTQNAYNYNTYLNTVGNDNKGKLFLGKSSINVLTGRHNIVGSIIKYYFYVYNFDITHGNRVTDFTFSTGGGSNPLTGTGIYTYY